MDGEDRDLAALMAGGTLDRAMIERLKVADREAMRASLSKHLDGAEVERILARVAALVAALPRE